MHNMAPLNLLLSVKCDSSLLQIRLNLNSIKSISSIAETNYSVPTRLKNNLAYHLKENHYYFLWTLIIQNRLLMWCLNY